MDGDRFDNLTRALGSGQSRRHVLKTLAGGALAAVGATLSLERAAAARRRSVGNSCKLNADCASGLCVQEARGRKTCHCTNPGDCPVSKDQCRPTACLPSGYCGTPITVGAPCDDGDACTTGDVCQANGTCAGTPVVCPTPTVCQASVACNPVTGICLAVNKADGTLCDDGDACTVGDSCRAGVCAPGPAKSCPVCQACAGGACQAAIADPSCPDGCCNGVCCPTGETCCNGACCAARHICANASCQTCAELRAPCDPNASLCCQDEPTYCYPAGVVEKVGEQCCRPVGGHCDPTHLAPNGDCCANVDYFTGSFYVDNCSGGVCGAYGAACGFDSDCVSGQCRGHCNNISPVQVCATDQDCGSSGFCIEIHCQ